MSGTSGATPTFALSRETMEMTTSGPPARSSAGIGGAGSVAEPPIGAMAPVITGGDPACSMVATRFAGTGDACEAAGAATRHG